jgi:ABC-type molybdate transport system substrate-binding protein
MKGAHYVPDTKSYKPVEQAMVLLKNRHGTPEAAGFMNFMLSAACKPVFEKYGFTCPSHE